MKTFLKFVPVVILALFSVSCISRTTEPTPAATVPPTGIPTVPPTTPSAIVPPGTTATFDFDSGSQVTLGQSTPFDQMSGGVTAHFSSPSDPAAFSIQNYSTTFFTLPQFSGNYLYPNKSSRTYLHIGFSQPLSSIALTFATIEYHGVGEVDEPSAIKLTAYMNTTEALPVGSTTARGTFPSNYTFPQGTLSFYSGGDPFNLVLVELTYQPKGGTSFLVDNITVTTSR